MGAKYVRSLLVTSLLMMWVACQVEAADCSDDIPTNTDPGQATAIVTWLVRANVTCSPESGDAFDVGITTVSCYDMDDNTTCSFDVTVTDNEDPTISCPDDIYRNTDTGASTASGVTWTVPQGSDNVGIDQDSRRCDRTSGLVFPIGVAVVTCEVRDTAGNTASCTFRVTVRDNEAPVFTACPDGPIRRTIPDFNPVLPTPSLPVTWDAPEASDNSGGAVVLKSSHEPGDEFPLGVTRVEYNATDGSGNTKNGCPFDVQIVVHPQNNYIFTESISTSCLTIVWPEYKDQAVEEYAIYSWKQGASKPDARLRTIVTPQRGNVINTYLKRQICSLSPGELYTVEVGTESGQAISSVQQWTKPYPPGTGTVVPGTVSHSSAELSWTRVGLQNVEQYKVTLSNGRDLGYVTKTTDRLMVDSLYPGRGYSAYVTAVVGSGEMRIESGLRGLYFTTASLPRSELLAYNYTESTIALAWRTQAGPTNRDPYLLFIEPADAKENYLTTVVSRALFEGLKPNTEYRILLVSNLGLSLRTTQTTRPGRVRNIRPTVVSDEAITLEWEPPREGDVDSYEVYTSPGESSEPATVSGTSHAFSSLTKGTEYFFKIVSVYHGVRSVPQTLMVTAGVTEADPSPVNIPAIAVGSGLGVLAVALIISIVVMAVKYRELQETGGNSDRTETSLRRTKSDNSKTDHYQRYQTNVQDSNVVYESPKRDTDSQLQPARLLSSDPSYQNAIIGRAPKRGPHQNKPQIPMLPIRRHRENSAVANVTG